MKFIKNFFFGVGILFFLSSCDPDTCKNVICGEFGICEDGECFCEEGYAKDDSGLCNLRFRDLVTGEWESSDLCDIAGASTDSVNISDDANDINKVLITGWLGVSDSLVVTVSEYDYTISRQSPDNNNIFIEGTASYDLESDLMEWSYVITDETNLPIIVDSCTATWTR